MGLKIVMHMYVLKHSRKHRQLSLFHLMMPKMMMIAICQTIYYSDDELITDDKLIDQENEDYEMLTLSNDPRKK